MSGKYMATALVMGFFLTFVFAAYAAPGSVQELDTSRVPDQNDTDTSTIPDTIDGRMDDSASCPGCTDSGGTDGDVNQNPGENGMPGTGGNSGQGNGNQCDGNFGNQGYGGRSGVYGDQGFGGMNPQGAAIPHYLVADASLFIANAATTARIMQEEGKLSMQDVNMLGNQARYLHDILGRAIQDLQLLQTDAERSNPKATLGIRETITQLTAAEGQIRNITIAANQGTLSLACTTTVNAALANLRNAQNSVSKIGDAYNAMTFTSLGNPQCPAPRKAVGPGASSGRKGRK